MSTKPAPAPKDEIYGVMAEYATTQDLLHAAERVRAQGYSRLDAYSPFPVHGLDRVLGNPGSKVPWIVLLGAIFGGSFGLWLQWWTAAVNYPIKVAGKPYFSIPAFVPVTFELTVLFSAFATLLGMLALNKLPQYYHPVFKHSTFHRASDDRFFLAIEADDPMFEVEKARQLLISTGGANVELVEG